MHTLRWSHDGKKLAYIGSSDEVTMPKLFISKVDAGTFALASESITYPLELEWTDGDRALFYVAAVRGEHLLYRARSGLASNHSHSRHRPSADGQFRRRWPHRGVRGHR